VAAGGGCASNRWISVRSVPHNPLVERLQLQSYWGPKLHPRTEQVLRRYGLPPDAPAPRLAGQLRQIADDDPSLDNIYAFAEVAFLAGQKLQKSDALAALDLYLAACAGAYRYLFDPQFYAVRNPYDPLYRGASDLYNGSLENVLRILRAGRALTPGESFTVESPRDVWDVSIVARGGAWAAAPLERIEFVSDYEVTGFKNHYRTYGLGVPLIAVRKKQAEHPHDRFYPQGLALPLTAFVRPSSLGAQRPEASAPPAAPGGDSASAGGAQGGGPRRRSIVLELYDPLVTTDILCEAVRVPLESNLTAPLAYFLHEAALEPHATRGLLNSAQGVGGLLFSEPYEPGKIPVVLLHGLWSEPTAWSEMLNELRGSPEIRAQYQFWFYMYPTGQPFWYTAAQLRDELQAVREALDPRRQEPALDHMVLVGHSMGGLIAHMQTVDSGEHFWQVASRQPLSDIKAGDEVKVRLARMFYFHPQPAVRRVVLIATPHRGSRFSNATTQWLSNKLITLPALLMDQFTRLLLDNPSAFPSGSPVRRRTSIDSLAPDSPLLPVLLESPPARWVQYHSIVGRSSPSADGDGVVTLDSAQFPRAATQVVVESSHNTIHRHPLTILEVRRILREHRDQFQRWTQHMPPPTLPPGPRPTLPAAAVHPAAR
jgi:pimeloyl-ACP methyl ester carboxylesterase